MRIFIKNINLKELISLGNFPIQGLIFSISQKNAEEIRQIIENTPFYLTVLGEISCSNKYEIEELIFFCKLKGLIISDSNLREFSCPKIVLMDKPYNVLINENGKIITRNIELDLLEEHQNIEALVLDLSELIRFKSKILKIWTNNKVV